MTTVQYTLSVKNGAVAKEEGNFFKANPFQVTVDGVELDIRLIHDTNHEVVYEVKEGNKVLAHLEHPDFAPDCTLAELETHFNPSNKKGADYIAALIRLGVAKGQWKAYAEEHNSSISFDVKQPRFL